MTPYDISISIAYEKYIEALGILGSMVKLADSNEDKNMAVGISSAVEKLQAIKPILTTVYYKSVHNQVEERKHKPLPKKDSTKFRVFGNITDVSEYINKQEE